MKRTWLAVSIGAALVSGTVAWGLDDGGRDAATASSNTGLSADPVPASPADRAPAENADAPAQDLLGEPYENQAAGLSLRVPAGCHRIASTGAGDDLGVFGDEKRHWELKITQITRPQPTSLTQTNNNFGQPVPGLLDQTVASLKRDLSGCQILRQDLTNTRDGDPKIKDNVGMIAVRYTAAAGHYLSQQAIIQASDRNFFLIALTTPGSNDTGADAPEDKGERVAVETFRQMLDSVRLLDVKKIAKDQEDRLIRTRALMYNWKNPKRLYSVLIPEQWLRIIRAGKDIGYSYITEQTAAGIPRPLKRGELNSGKSDRDLVQPGDGILIGVRARSIDQPQIVSDAQPAKGPIQVDTASWLFTTPDRKLEDWSRVSVVNDGTKDKTGKPELRQLEEFGASDQQVTRELDKVAEANNPQRKHDENPPVRVRENYTLNVTSISGSGASDPVTRQLVPWYLPQALDHLLPRLLPLDQAKSYLFATYVPETREVMHRYVEVGKPGDFHFAGNVIHAVPITDRLGWHGSVTTHYMSLEGKYLGSENKDAHLVIVPADAQTILAVWKNANLTQPGGTDRVGVHKAHD